MATRGTVGQRVWWGELRLHGIASLLAALGREGGFVPKRQGLGTPEGAEVGHQDGALGHGHGVADCDNGL